MIVPVDASPLVYEVIERIDLIVAKQRDEALKAAKKGR